MSQKRSSELRIIGGQFRSRKIAFSEEDGLRPTHNRIRETLFNWLAPTIENSICLDAFAGSGALGFEAISRGAKHTTFCDISIKAIQSIKSNAAILKITNADFMPCDFTQQNTLKNKFDIIFLDPPFQKNLILKSCEMITENNLLNSHGQIYLEFQKNSVDLSLLPKNWTVKKHKETNTIEYILCELVG